MGLSWASHNTLIYTSELILCSTSCIHSAKRHNIHMYPYFQIKPNHSLEAFLPRNCYYFQAYGLVRVNTTPENAALFLWLGLPSTLISHENCACRKRSSNRWNLKKPALRFSVDGKQKWSFTETMTLGLSCGFSARVFLDNKSEKASVCCVLNSPGAVWTESI